MGSMFTISTYKAESVVDYMRRLRRAKSRLLMSRIPLATQRQSKQLKILEHMQHLKCSKVPFTRKANEQLKIKDFVNARVLRITSDEEYNSMTLLNLQNRLTTLNINAEHDIETLKKTDFDFQDLVELSPEEKTEIWRLLTSIYHSTMEEELNGNEETFSASLRNKFSTELFVRETDDELKRKILQYKRRYDVKQDSDLVLKSCFSFAYRKFVDFMNHVKIKVK
ncbi:unnamed protein product [Mytilus edulis]|uniref:Uncharacterized protein n=1 Tax=Mytilus edulis TaxID=6550 RepID=A0A8S3QXB7_MYTED|nr:unnamed protein product [Mytilus edulis]